MGKTKATKPTLAQKKIIKAAGHNFKDFLVIKETSDELHLIYRGSGKTLVLPKQQPELVKRKKGRTYGTSIKKS